MDSVTQEPLLPDEPCAHLGLRFLAWLIDSVILYFIGALVSPFFMNFMAEFWADKHTNSLFPLTILMSPVMGTVLLRELVLDFPYYVCFESSQWQATLGKQFLKIKVATLQGEKITRGKAFKRFLARVLVNRGSSLLLAFCIFCLALSTVQDRGGHQALLIMLFVPVAMVIGVGFILDSAFVFWTPKKQRISKKQTLHDLIAGTVVVKKVKETPSETVVSVPFSQDL